MPEKNDKGKVKEPPAEPGSEPAGSVSDDPPAEPVVEPEEPQFSRGDLKGKDPKEIESYISLLEGVTREQGTKLSEVEKDKAQLESEAAARAAAPRVDDEELNVAFLDNPMAAMRQAQVESEERILGKMGEMIEPFKLGLARDAESDAIDQARVQFPDLDTYLPQMRVYAQQAGASLAVPGNVQAYYYMVKGKSVTEGGAPVVTTETPGAATPSVEVPQGRPQNQPLPTAGEVTKVRELTELEARLARENNMTPEQYLEWLEAPPEAVTEPKEEVKP